MYDPRRAELKRELVDILWKMPPPKWIEDMIDHYYRTGSFRQEDLRRLLGDPSKGVEVRPDMSVADFLPDALRERKD